jgi:hypothetical protein
MSDQIINQQWRVIGPTSEQWGEIKEVFTQLYILENRKLKDVRDILSKKHGFNARSVLPIANSSGAYSLIPPARRCSKDAFSIGKSARTTRPKTRKLSPRR